MLRAAAQQLARAAGGAAGLAGPLEAAAGLRSTAPALTLTSLRHFSAAEPPSSSAASEGGAGAGQGGAGSSGRPASKEWRTWVDAKLDSKLEGEGRDDGLLSRADGCTGAATATAAACRQPCAAPAGRPGLQPCKPNALHAIPFPPPTCSAWAAACHGGGAGSGGGGPAACSGRARGAGPRQGLGAGAADLQHHSVSSHWMHCTAEQPGALCTAHSRCRTARGAAPPPLHPTPATPAHPTPCRRAAGRRRRSRRPRCRRA